MFAECVSVCLVCVRGEYVITGGVGACVCECVCVCACVCEHARACE